MLTIITSHISVQLNSCSRHPSEGGLNQMRFLGQFLEPVTGKIKYCNSSHSESIICSVAKSLWPLATCVLKWLHLVATALGVTEMTSAFQVRSGWHAVPRMDPAGGCDGKVQIKSTARSSPSGCGLPVSCSRPGLGDRSSSLPLHL